jgi:hypothetical protein
VFLRDFEEIFWKSFLETLMKMIDCTWGQQHSVVVVALTL